VCGRYVSTQSPDDVARYFAAVAPEESLPPSWNVAPSNDVWAVVEDADGTRRVAAFHWGLVPAWAKDLKVGYRMINARAETLAGKGAFKPAFTKRRCIVPMDGFYEWKAGAAPKARKQPMFVSRLDGEPLAVAGLWETWRDRAAGPDAPWLHSLTIVTTSANATMAPVHDRMPVVLPPRAWETWLDPENHDLDRLAGLLVPAPDDLLSLRPVSPAVNDVRSKGPELLDPYDPDAAAEAAAAASGGAQGTLL
jgi:putative SOS response-associated peptidase YedK